DDSPTFLAEGKNLDLGMLLSMPAGRVTFTFGDQVLDATSEQTVLDVNTMLAWVDQVGATSTIMNETMQLISLSQSDENLIDWMSTNLSTSLFDTPGLTTASLPLGMMPFHHKTLECTILTASEKVAGKVGDLAVTGGVCAACLAAINALPPSAG